MNAYLNYLNSLVNKNKAEFSAYNLKWINPYTADEYNEIREKYLSENADSMMFSNTKPYYNKISKGCKLCGQGLWSCLFITNKCNGRCFYCPAEQKNDEIPSSQGLNFPTAASYAEYVSHFKFKGVSFSGGEPLLYPERLLDYLREIRKQCSPDIYIWMYTNGILADRELFKELKNSGLDEIRFDIGATSYNLDKVKLAKGIFKNITVEIPAVPEEAERLKAMLPEMIEAGVTNLNLHQLRLTKYNAAQLSKHDYTYIAAEKPIVLESELTALDIISHAQKNNFELGVNYCSFFYKNRFQAAGFRKIISQASGVESQNISEKGFEREKTSENLKYSVNIISDSGKLSDSLNKICLAHKIYDIRKDTVYICNMNDVDMFEFETFFGLTSSEAIPDDEELFKIWNFERIENSLRKY